MSRQELIDKEAAEYTIRAEIFKAGVKFADTHFPWHKTSEDVTIQKSAALLQAVVWLTLPVVSVFVIGTLPSNVGIRRTRTIMTATKKAIRIGLTQTLFLNRLQMNVLSASKSWIERRKM